MQRLIAAEGASPPRREPLAFYVDLVRHPFAQRDVVHPLRCATLLLLAQLCNVAGYLGERRR